MEFECGCPIQPLLIEAVAPKLEHETIEERFRRFHAENPHIYFELCRLARDAKRQGRKRVGIGMLWEVMRWNLWARTERADDRFKLNNNYRSRYSRMIQDRESDLEGLFETRALTAE